MDILAAVATREGGVDRNFRRLKMQLENAMSPPARVAWIETLARSRRSGIGRVATREGGVDRNIYPADAMVAVKPVATREGGVDRNASWMLFSVVALRVATREGGVDRNMIPASKSSSPGSSPPARVAWIETHSTKSFSGRRVSPPARVAWIETLSAAATKVVSICRHPRGWRG